MIRTGIVGCGRMAGIHLAALRGLKEVEVVGVADADLARAQAFAKDAGIPVAVADLEALVSQARAEALHIVTPPSSHSALTRAGLHAGCHVLVEKPLALSTGDARQIAAAVPKGRLVAVCHNHIFDPAVQEAVARAAKGRLGEVIGVAAFHGAHAGGPAWVDDLPFGTWMEEAPHPLYLACLFMGDALDIRAVSDPGPARGEVRAVVRHARGLSSIAISGATVPYRNSLTVYGTKRTLEVDLVSQVLVEARPRGGGRLLGKGITALDQAGQLLLGNFKRALALALKRERSWPGLRALVAAFHEAIRTGAPSPVPVEEGVRVTEIADRIAAQLGIPPRG